MRLLTILIELFGICAILAGIGVEIVYKADAGFIVLTSGSLIMACGAFIYAKCKLHPTS